MISPPTSTVIIYGKQNSPKLEKILNLEITCGSKNVLQGIELFLFRFVNVSEWHGQKGERRLLSYSLDSGYELKEPKLRTPSNSGSIKSF